MTFDTPLVLLPSTLPPPQQLTSNDSFNPFGFHPVDPQTPIDLAAVGIGASVLLFNFFAMSLVFSKYKSMAVKTKHPILMMISLIFNALLFIGYCVSRVWSETLKMLTSELHKLLLKLLKLFKFVVEWHSAEYIV